VVPFYLSLVGFLPIDIAFYASIGAALAILFLLGVFLGRVSEGNLLYSGIKMVVAGVAVALLALLLNSH
jgi:predicted membrane protein (TIGR00267 family)